MTTQQDYEAAIKFFNDFYCDDDALTIRDLKHINDAIDHVLKMAAKVMPEASIAMWEAGIKKIEDEEGDNEAFKAMRDELIKEISSEEV